MDIIDYKDGRVVKVNGVKMPDYTLQEQYLLRVGYACFWNENYKQLTMPQALVQYKQDNLENIPEEYRDYISHENYYTLDKWEAHEMHNIIHAPCGNVEGIPFRITDNGAEMTEQINLKSGISTDESVETILENLERIFE